MYLHKKYVEINNITYETLKAAVGTNVTKEQVILNSGRQSLLNRLKRSSINKLIDELALKNIDITNMHPDRALGIYSEYCSSVLVIN